MIRPQKSSAIRHVADLFIALYTLTGENRYLKSGLPALAQMCWFQDTWTNRIGAFGAGNTLAEDEDHAAFGRTLLEYYMATRRPEHIERGIAAIRAGLAIGDPAAAAVQHWAIRKFGSALVDVRNHTAYAVGPYHINELSVKSGTIALDLHNGLTPGNNHPTTVKFHGLRGESYRVTINGEGKRYPKVELETGIKVAL
jgi:hypothetical protein